MFWKKLWYNLIFPAIFGLWIFLALAFISWRRIGDEFLGELRVVILRNKINKEKKDKIKKERARAHRRYTKGRISKEEFEEIMNNLARSRKEV